MKIILYIAAGGALGSGARYAVILLSHQSFGVFFPFGTLIANSLGSFILGLLLSIYNVFSLSTHEIEAFWIIGVLGAFTTFSAVSSDTMDLLDQKETLLVILYVCGPVLTAIFGCILGWEIVRIVCQ